MGRSLILLMLGTTLACTPRVRLSVPPHRASMSWGTVHADTPERAEELAARVDDVLARVVAWLPGARLRPFEVLLLPPGELPTLRSDEVPGMVAETDRGTLMMLTDPDDELVLAHEAVHVLVDAVWDGAPQAIEEGLCQYVAGLALESSTPAALCAEALTAMAGDPLRPTLHVGPDFSMHHEGAGIAGVDLSDPGAVLGLEGDLHGEHRALELAARQLGFLVVHRLAGREGLAGLHARLAAMSDRPVPEQGHLLAARAGLTSACSAAAGARSLVDPGIAEALAAEVFEHRKVFGMGDGPVWVQVGEFRVPAPEGWPGAGP